MNGIIIQIALLTEVLRTVFRLKKPLSLKNEPTLNLENYKISYAQYGRGEKNVILIHGLGESKESWLNVAQELSHRYTVFTLDLPLFGSTDVPSSPLTLHEYARIVHACMQKLKLERATIVGHSFGGKIALYFAHTFPLETEKLVLYSADFSLDISFNRRVYFFLLNLLMSQLMKYPVLLYMRFNNSAYLGFLKLVQTLIWGSRHDFVSLLSKIETNTLLIYGTFDFIVSLKNGEGARQIMPHAKLVIFQKSSHLAHEEERSKFLSILSDFMES